jgi:hypothetical protein
VSSSSDTAITQDEPVRDIHLCKSNFSDGERLKRLKVRGRARLPFRKQIATIYDDTGASIYIDRHISCLLCVDFNGRSDGAFIRVV